MGSMSVAPKVVVLGGTGYIGRHVVEVLARRGARVVSVSRGGARAREGTTDGDGRGWHANVSYVQGDVRDTSSYSRHLAGASALVSTVGAVVPQLSAEARQQERDINGATAFAADACEDAGVNRIVYVSATMPPWMLSGYRLGKMDVERRLATFKGHSTVLRPAAVSGTRITSGGMRIPLYLVFTPMSTVMQLPLISGACDYAMRMLPSVLSGVLEPPVKMETVTDAICAHALVDVSKEETGAMTSHTLLTNRALLTGRYGRHALGSA